MAFEWVSSRSVKLFFSREVSGDDTVYYSHKNLLNILGRRCVPVGSHTHTRTRRRDTPSRVSPAAWGLPGAGGLFTSSLYP